jgi:hypothetical protein
MNNNKKSSLEWYAEKEHEIAREFVLANINHREYFDKKRELFEQAKAMHKQEGVDLYVNGMYKGQELYFGEDKIRLDVNSLKNCEKSAEQYYNEIFGGNNEQQ